MPDEYEEIEPSFSSFWPVLIFLVGFLIWTAAQLYTLNNQRAAFEAQYDQLSPSITPAHNAQTRLYSLASDLLETSSKDPYAAQVVREAGIRANGTNAPTETPPAAAKQP